MDITKTQFAKLVLGYLKIEQCHIAYNTFLSTSPYLKDYVNPTKRRHLVTRIQGLSLHDILEEFSKIYTIIQEHLEDTNYFNESNQSHLLHDQLIYLLEVDVPTRQSSPQSSTSVEIIPNGSEDELVSSSPPKKQISGSEGKSDLDKTEDSEDNGTHLSIQAITDTLLKHPEFQEKIAENINKVRLSDGALDTPEKLQNDIDSAIKAVLEKTQNDPMFETLMGEIIGTAADEEMIFNNEIQSPPSEEPPPLTPLSTQPKQPPQTEASMETIDDHIKVAVDSIVTASQQQVNNSQFADNSSGKAVIDMNKRLTVNTNNDIIFYDGTIDNYMQQQQQQDNMNPSPAVPPLVLNNLLVMTSTPSHQVNSVDATKPFYLFSGSPYVNVAPTQPYFVSNKVLTEKDILSMPTVILNDDKSKNTEPKSTKKKSEDALNEYLSFNKSKVEPKAIIHVEVLQEDDDKSTKEQQEQQPNTNEQNAANPPTSDTAKRTPESKGGGGGGSGRRSGVSTPRSTNKSHVRALDFKFQTPSKDVVEVRKTSPKVSTAKSLFSSGTKSKSPKKKRAETKKCGVGSGRSWDADLRATLPDLGHNVKKKKKPPPAKSKPKPNLNRTEEDAKQIENNLHLGENLKEKLPQPSEKKNGCSVDLQQEQQQQHKNAVEVADVVNTMKEDEQEKEKERLQQVEKAEEETSQKRQQQPRGRRSRKQKSAGKANVTVQIIESENQVHEIALRNFNAKPRFHRKCNIENNTKFKPIPDKEVVSVGVACTPLIIATSPTVVDVDSNSLPVLSIPDTSSFATPEALKTVVTEAAKPISAGRNIMPILETPYKEGICPKTPGRTPMSTVETPFTKVFNEQMEGIDISSIQTPQLTPFPITPFIHGETPYSNRPTDYSTSSSYYQPSDTEQNKSLELQILEECKRLEVKKTPLHQLEVDKQPPPPSSPPAPEEQELLKKQDAAHRVIADKMKSLSSNVIGRKNLSMVPKDVHKTQDDEDDVDNEEEEEDEDDSDDSSSSCDSDSSSCSSSSSGETYVNRTIVEVKDETRYSLRSTRQQNNDEIKNIISQVNVKNELVNASNMDHVSTKQQVLRELDEKRRRTIAKFKNENTPSAETRNRKLLKTKTETPVQQNLTPKRVLRSTVKTKVKKEEVIDTVEPMQLVETEMLCSNSSGYCDDEENGKDDKEAEKLVTGLRERGIYLIPNKFAKRNGVGGGVESGKKDHQEVSTHSSDLNNSNEENKINAQNVQKSSNTRKEEMYSFLFGPDDSKDCESEIIKTTTNKDDSGKQHQNRRRRPNHRVENRTNATKDGVKKSNGTKSDKSTQEGQVKRAPAKSETNRKKDSKSLKDNRRNSKTTKSSDSLPPQQEKDVVESSEKKKTDSKSSKSEEVKKRKKSEEETNKVSKSQGESQIRKSDEETKKIEKSDEIKIICESETKSSSDKNTEITTVVSEQVNKVKESADDVTTKDLKYVDAVDCLKKSEEDKVMDRTKESEVKKKIQSTNLKTEHQISKQEKEGDPTISKGVVCNSGDANEGSKGVNDVEKSKKIMLNVDAVSKTDDSKTKDAATRCEVFVMKQQEEDNEPWEDEFDRSLMCIENFEYRYVESDPPHLPDVQLPLDIDETVEIGVLLENNRIVPIKLQKVGVRDFWHVAPKPPNAQTMPKKRKRNFIEVLGDVSVTPVSKVAKVKEEIKQTTTVDEESSKKKFSKHQNIEDIVADLKKPKTDSCLLKEVDVDNFLDKLHGA
ncbi:PREDICTED: uncharacterized protein LOC108565774 isoform X1 [Nicrophorus vespilloides]|uniref:Uncharacterized protein LOC108565774 isoform X1 n=1 Tax=Nicrophorus vespilloides TaxID=110193 RepID=A0ABM1N224_NICVS|nr:PREDICTED: uncharacterized protein LOC108565774 isoform X1 [Nicrophorus vespilloides]